MTHSINSTQFASNMYHLYLLIPFLISFLFCLRHKNKRGAILNSISILIFSLTILISSVISNYTNSFEKIVIEMILPALVFIFVCLLAVFNCKKICECDKNQFIRLLFYIVMLFGISIAMIFIAINFMFRI